MDVLEVHRGTWINMYRIAQKSLGSRSNIYLDQCQVTYTVYTEVKLSGTPCIYTGEIVWDTCIYTGEIVWDTLYIHR